MRSSRLKQRNCSAWAAPLLGAAGLLLAAPMLAGAQLAAPVQPPPADVTDKERALLQKINALKAPRWRSFGPCRYDWSGWRLVADGVRTTQVQCGPLPEAAAPGAGAAVDGAQPLPQWVAVHCASLKLSLRTGEQPWSNWRLPLALDESKVRGGEDRMVASLCANVQPEAKPAAQPGLQPAAKPVAPAAKPAVKPSAKPPSQPAAKR